VALRYGLLFIPYLLALLLDGRPAASYLVAWGGSFWILYLTLTGKIRLLPGDRSLARQLFRPVGFTQFIYAGYTALTSIFYFLDLNGYFYLSHNPFQAASYQELALAAEAQRYYLLSHAGFSAGVLLLMDYRRSGEWTLRPDIDRTPFLLYLAGGFLLGANVVRFVPGIGQFAVRMDMIALVAAVMSFALALIQKRQNYILIGGGVYALSMVQAFMSGWKGEIIILFLLLAVFLYPVYKRTILMLAPTGLVFLFAILPAFGNTFRALNWHGNVEAGKAAQVALDRVFSEDTNLARTNWHFLTGRLSEIGMFSQYIDRVPDERPYYGLEIVENGIVGIIPSAVWSGKPSLEALSMERAYENDVVEPHSGASAKPKFVVDAYLSWGPLGVLIGSLLYGMVASMASRLGERWFGGYLLGSGLIYMSLFRILWRGNSFEFMFSALFWSFVFMGTLFVAGRMTGLLVPRRRRVEVAA
jgi:hypothetical protein